MQQEGWLVNWVNASITTGKALGVAAIRRILYGFGQQAAQAAGCGVRGAGEGGVVARWCNTVISACHSLPQALTYLSKRNDSNQYFLAAPAPLAARTRVLVAARSVRRGFCENKLLCSISGFPAAPTRPHSSSCMPLLTVIAFLNCLEGTLRAGFFSI